MIRETARRKTESYVEKALADGARLVTGGKRPADLKKGYFYAPTLFDDHAAVGNDLTHPQGRVNGGLRHVVGLLDTGRALRLQRREIPRSPPACPARSWQPPSRASDWVRSARVLYSTICRTG